MLLGIRVLVTSFTSLALVDVGPLLPARHAVEASPVVLDLRAEAAAFMAAYANDLRRGDHAAVAARYHSAGVYELRPGTKRLSSADVVTARYATDWRPPATFEWRDLSYEVVGPDAVIVVGLFAWATATGAAPLVQSYVALLQREHGPLRIRLEAEAAVPPIPRFLLGGGAALLVLGTLGADRLVRRLRQERRIARVDPGAVPSSGQAAEP
jgi:hypothetical protein